ncbi:site-specific integrase [Aurantimonas sp. E1-2-R+4]|uniref:site-specific integrase n=1 Tax=Aurantimonas sp. E1-2-R+4 TaxID=3113714 RepID=UPI003FA59537
MPLAENPLAKVRKPKAAAGRTRRLQIVELTALLAACDEARSDWLRPSILLAIETGMRRGEILNIRGRDVRLSDCLLCIPETKTDTPRTIPLSASAVDTLRPVVKAIASNSELLFPISANGFRLAWERCRRRAAVVVPSVASLRFHDLRHEAVSRFFELGLGVPEVAAISGHRDPRMLFRYTHLKPEDLVRRLQTLEAGNSA